MTRQFSDRETSLTRVGSLRLKDSSLPRMKEVALPSLATSAGQVRILAGKRKIKKVFSNVRLESTTLSQRGSS
jgi:hypothetical protein